MLVPKADESVGGNTSDTATFPNFIESGTQAGKETSSVRQTTANSLSYIRESVEHEEYQQWLPTCSPGDSQPLSTGRFCSMIKHRLIKFGHL